jgi:phosphatidate cytidylyltransferase
MLKQRVLTVVVALSMLLIVLFMLPPVITQVVITVLILIGAWEWSGLLRLEKMVTRLAYVILIAAFLAIVSFGLVADMTIDVVLKFALVWWLIALIWMFSFPTPIPILVGWICGMFVLIPAYFAIISLQPDMLLSVLIIVWATDIGAYFTGKYLGKVKLAPRISPRKTWEGVFGGLLAVAVLALLRALWLQIDIVVLLPFCLAIAIISIIGDLTVSMFKRNAGVKDSGRLFPGHGGLLDRIDSVAAAAPLFVLGISWMGLK